MVALVDFFNDLAPVGCVSAGGGGSRRWRGRGRRGLSALPQLQSWALLTAPCSLQGRLFLSETPWGGVFQFDQLLQQIVKVSGRLVGLSPVTFVDTFHITMYSLLFYDRFKIIFQTIVFQQRSVRHPP